MYISGGNNSESAHTEWKQVSQHSLCVVIVAPVKILFSAISTFPGISSFSSTLRMNSWSILLLFGSLLPAHILESNVAIKNFTKRTTLACLNFECHIFKNEWNNWKVNFYMTRLSLIIILLGVWAPSRFSWWWWKILMTGVNLIPNLHQHNMVGIV